MHLKCCLCMEEAVCNPEQNEADRPVSSPAVGDHCRRSRGPAPWRAAGHGPGRAAWGPVRALGEGGEGGWEGGWERGVGERGGREGWEGGWKEAQTLHITVNILKFSLPEISIF